jgi:single-strand DNA-binding protein
MLSEIMIIGRLGADGETHITPSGVTVGTMRVAVNRRWKQKKTNTPQEATDWFRVVLFDDRAEKIVPYAKKGTLVYITGRPQATAWKNKEGEIVAQMEIICSNLRFLSPRNQTNGQAANPPQDTGQADGGPPELSGEDSENREMELP